MWTDGICSITKLSVYTAVKAQRKTAMSGGISSEQSRVYSDMS